MIYCLFNTENYTILPNRKTFLRIGLQFTNKANNFASQSAFMNNNQPLNDLAQIRAIMERSTRFLSLSAWAAIMAGIYALVGAAIARRLVYFSSTIRYQALTENLLSAGAAPLFATAAAVLLLSAGTGLWLSYRKAQRAGQILWNQAAMRTAINFAIPMLAGGAFVLILYARGYYSLIAASMLIFYGLALLNAGNFTFSDIRKLGMWEVGIGLLAALLPNNGLLFWSLGFGLLHIIYGVILYYKYEKT